MCIISARTVKIAPKNETPEMRMLRVQMVVGGLDARTLAARAGVHVRTLQNLLCGAYRSWPLKARINVALGRRIFQKPSRTYRPRQQKEKT
jgi:hypothetical protein